jgi:hypothetical protein
VKDWPVPLAAPVLTTTGCGVVAVVDVAPPTGIGVACTVRVPPSAGAVTFGSAAAGVDGTPVVAATVPRAVWGVDRLGVGTGRSFSQAASMRLSRIISAITVMIVRRLLM